MKNYQIKFILKLQNGDSFKLEQQVISVEASNKKDALQVAAKKLYITINFKLKNYICLEILLKKRFQTIH